MSEVDQSIQDLAERIEKLFVAEKPLLSVDLHLWLGKHVVYLFSEEGKTWVVTETGQQFEIESNLNAMESKFKGYFIRVHRSYLVAMERITGVFERYPEEEVKGGNQDECEAGGEGKSNTYSCDFSLCQGIKKGSGSQ